MPRWGSMRNGIATSLQADVIGDVGAYSIYPWTCGLEPVQVVSFLPGPYKIGSYRGAVRGVATCKPPTGPYRGVGRPISTFVAERLMDLGAEGARHRSARDQAPQSGSGRGISVPDRFRHHLGQDRLHRMPGCRRRSRRLRRSFASSRPRRARQGRLFGIGIASYAELTGIGSRIAVAPGMPINTGSETAKITIDSTGAITAAFGVASHGQGLETTLAQIVADDLGAQVRGCPRHPGRQRRGADVDRHLCEPQRGARRRRGQACLDAAAGEDQARRLASPRSQPGRYRGLPRARPSCSVPTAR